MLVAVVDIPYADQLRRAAPLVAAAAASACDRWLAGPFEPIGERKGRRYSTLRYLDERSLADAAARIGALRAELDAAKIPDHLCLLFASDAAELAGIERETERLFARLEAAASPEWRSAGMVHVSAASLFAPAAALDGAGEFRALRPVPPARQPPAGSTGTTGRPRVARPNATRRIVDAAFSCLEGTGDRRLPVLVSGPEGVGKARAVREAVPTIAGAVAAESLVTVHTLFGRRSAVHPFLNSVRLPMLDDAPRHLRPWEAAVWEKNGALLRSLALDSPSDGAAGGSAYCPDRLSVDFHGAYRLYLVAYVRAMESLGAPAVVLFEDIHTYHPEALRFTGSLVSDLLAMDSFAPILTCREGHDACGLFGADVLAVGLPPVALEENRGIAKAMYPGLVLPEKAARRIRSLAEGRLDPVEPCLRHLERAGKIRGHGERYGWSVGEAARLPVDGTRAVWEQIESLPRQARELLYLCSLGGGVLPAAATVELALALGTKVDAARSAAERRQELRAGLGALAEAGMIRSADVPVFLFPTLRSRLAQSLEDWAARTRSAFSGRLESAWRAGQVRHLVLAFSVLRADRLDTALEVLDTLVTRKLDELDVRGSQYFLDPARLRMDRGASARQRERYVRAAALGTLRAQLLLGAWERADKAMDVVANLEVPGDCPTGLGHRALAEARYHLVKSEATAASKAAKAAALSYHDAGDERAERRAEATLGAALLAEGRVEEALEYFGFVVRSPACDPFPRVLASGLSAVASYLHGNVSAALRSAEAGAALAARSARREWEALMLFLGARLGFDLGRFDDAVEALEGLLAFTRLYGMARAAAVVSAWMGRCLAYGGRAEHSASLLGRLAPSPEVRLFQAEGLYLAGRADEALRTLDGVEALRRRQPMQPGERVSWENGFASVEDRCALLRRDGGTLSRLVRGFRAYLSAVAGRPEQAARELYRITREEQVADVDPFQPLYAYWYAATLPEEGGGGSASDHRLTVLNKALKQFQKRSSRIEDARDRAQLARGSYWTARLLEEARARRLA